MRDMIVFGEDWGGHPSSTQHLIRHMAPGRNLLWVNSVGMRRPRLTLRDARRACAKLTAALARPARAAGAPPPFPVTQPLMLPMARSAAARALNRAVLARQMASAARAAGLRRPVLWTSLPSAVDAARAIDAAAVVYYCGDDFGALAGVDHAAARALEAELAARADLILAASPALAARFPAAKTHLLEHGVDLEHFVAPRARAADLPDRGPVAGFYGALAPWIDTDLIAATARAMPDWRFLLIGPVQTDVTALAACPNVILAGPRPHAELPAYAQHWTAGIIPFRNTPQIAACNPLKLREYLAAGRPVVATDFPALAPYRGVVRVAQTAACMAEALRAAAADPGPPEARRTAIAGESWARQAARAAALIDALPG